MHIFKQILSLIILYFISFETVVCPDLAVASKNRDIALEHFTGLGGIDALLNNKYSNPYEFLFKKKNDDKFDYALPLVDGYFDEFAPLVEGKVTEIDGGKILIVKSNDGTNTAVNVDDNLLLTDIKLNKVINTNSEYIVSFVPFVNDNGDRVNYLAAFWQSDILRQNLRNLKNDKFSVEKALQRLTKPYIYAKFKLIKPKIVECEDITSIKTNLEPKTVNLNSGNVKINFKNGEIVNIDVDFALVKQFTDLTGLSDFVSFYKWYLEKRMLKDINQLKTSDQDILWPACYFNHLYNNDKKELNSIFYQYAYDAYSYNSKNVTGESETYITDSYKIPEADNATDGNTKQRTNQGSIINSALLTLNSAINSVTTTTNTIISGAASVVNTTITNASQLANNAIQGATEVGNTVATQIVGGGSNIVQNNQQITGAMVQRRNTRISNRSAVANSRAVSRGQSANNLMNNITGQLGNAVQGITNAGNAIVSQGIEDANNLVGEALQNRNTSLQTRQIRVQGRYTAANNFAIQLGLAFNSAMQSLTAVVDNFTARALELGNTSVINRTTARRQVIEMRGQIGQGLVNALNNAVNGAIGIGSDVVNASLNLGTTLITSVARNRAALINLRGNFFDNSTLIGSIRQYAVNAFNVRADARLRRLTRRVNEGLFGFRGRRIERRDRRSNIVSITGEEGREYSFLGMAIRWFYKDYIMPIVNTVQGDIETRMSTPDNNVIVDPIEQLLMRSEMRRYIRMNYNMLQVIRSGSYFIYQLYDTYVAQVVSFVISIVNSLAGSVGLGAVVGGIIDIIYNVLIMTTWKFFNDPTVYNAANEFIRNWKAGNPPEINGRFWAIRGAIGALNPLDQIMFRITLQSYIMRNANLRLRIAGDFQRINVITNSYILPIINDIVSIIFGIIDAVVEGGLGTIPIVGSFSLSIESLVSAILGVLEYYLIKLPLNTLSSDKVPKMRRAYAAAWRQLRRQGVKLKDRPDAVRAKLK
jgi:hypothetical protein